MPVSVQPGAGPYSLDLKSINNYYAFGMLMPVAKLPPPPPALFSPLERESRGVKMAGEKEI